MPAHARPLVGKPRALRPRPGRRGAAAFLAAALLLPSAWADSDVPHRRLATERFPGRPELNNPLAAYLPQFEQIDRALRLAGILREEAERLGQDLASVPPEFFADLVEALYVRAPDLLAALPELARAAELADPEDTIRIESLQRLTEALEASPYRAGVERFVVSSALRARGERSAAAFGRKLKEIGAFFRRAGVSEGHLDRLSDLYHRGEVGFRRLFGNLRALTDRAAGRAGALTLPPFVVPLVMAAAGALGIVFFLRRKGRAEPPPPLPDFGAVGPRGEDFARALLAFYRRVLHDAGLPFRGRVLADLARDAAARRPEIAAQLPPLNRAFYEIWYRAAEKPQGELSALNGRLASLAAAARYAQQG